MAKLLTVRDARARFRPCMRQEDLAAKAKIDQAYVSLIEAGKRSPSADVKRRIAKALGLAPDRLQFPAHQLAQRLDELSA